MQVTQDRLDILREGTCGALNPGHSKIPVKGPTLSSRFFPEGWTLLKRCWRALSVTDN